MATVDMNLVQIYRPPVNPPFGWQKQIASSYTNGRSIRAITSLSQAALPRNKLGQILESSSQFKPKIVATLNKRHDIESQVQRRNDSVKAQDVASSNHDSTNGYDESDDDLLSLKELSQSAWPPNTSTNASKIERPLQHPDKLALDATSMPIDYTEPTLSSHQGDNRGSQNLPVIIEDNEPESINAEDKAKAASDNVDAIMARRDASPSSTLLNQDPAFELGKPINLSAPEQWYDVEAGCYIDEELPLGLGLKEQQGLAPHHYSSHHSPRPSHHQVGQHDNNRNTQRTPEEPLDKDGGGESDEDISDLERDMLLAFEEQEKSSSATAPGSPQPPRLYTELGYCSPLRIEEELEEQQQQQEVAAEAVREEEEEGDDDNEKRERRREKRQHQDEAEESSNIRHYESGGNSHNTSSEDGEDPRPAKRLKLRSAPAHKSLPPQPQNLMPPSATQLEVTSSCDNLLESRKSSSPSPTGDEEPSSNAGAAYQEWPMRGFFKLITIGNEVRYGIEFSLEDVQQLCAATFPLHTSSAGSNASFSARPFSASARAENAPSQSKRPRFTEEDDARLADLKQRGWSWEDIQRSFPGRSTGSLQVRYSTKLKGRNSVMRKAIVDN